VSDPRKLPDPYPRVVATVEFVAAVAGGHVNFDSTERGRKSGDQHVLDAAVWMPDLSENEQLFILQCADVKKPAGVAAIEQAALAGEDLRAAAVTVCGPAGFTRPARKRAEEVGVELFTPAEPGDTTWPQWLGAGGFGQEDLRWQVTGVTLPPGAGVPASVLDKEFSPNDGLFENPTGTQLSASKLMSRWLKIAENEQSLTEGAGTPQKPASKDILLRFDRPMKLLATTIQELPRLDAISFTVKYWIESQQIPTRLEEAVEEDGAVVPTLVTPAFEEDGKYIRMMIRLGPDEETGALVPMMQLQDAEIPDDEESTDS
jgi:hypothetical protein